MRQSKGIFVGAVAVAMLLASGCESKSGRPQVDRQDTLGAQPNNRGSDLSPQGPAGAVRDDGTDRGTGGSGMSTGSTGTGDVQSAPAPDSTSSPQMGGTTGTGTEGSDMGSGGATNSAQGQGTPPR